MKIYSLLYDVRMKPKPGFSLCSYPQKKLDATSINSARFFLNAGCILTLSNRFLTLARSHSRCLRNCQRASGETYRLIDFLEKGVVKSGVRPPAVPASTFINKITTDLQERVRAGLLAASRLAEAQRLTAMKIAERFDDNRFTIFAWFIRAVEVRAI